MLRKKITPLKTFIEEGSDMESIRSLFSSFRCSRNKDVIHYLDNYALKNELLGTSRNYLIFAPDGNLAAFFTVALTAIDCSTLSNRRKRDAFGDMPALSKRTHVEGYLLTQVARDDRYSHEDIDGKELIQEAEKTIDAAAAIAGGHIISLDCKERLVSYYESCGYKTLFYDEEKELYKLFKCLDELSVA